ncbi:UDP-2,4-diacetamido-2,4,6-trideoxy-beta-L-altropyranose hydrolase, partial [uncultured Clostridium sp.]|uniref:UDP-2,4-diacetamido-2,4, 6-trideoxy-beta-L-altropyranose hydrolase n=1 Tax=uncultured Clostridium sp. TaxID=59620 RepID=UPI0025FAE095
MKVFIRADGGRSIGMGHVMRMLALASEFRKENEVFFLCKNNESGKYEAGIDTIEKNKFKVLKINDKKNIVDEIISMQNKYKADILITDSYDVNEEYFYSLKSKFKITGYVDDVNKCYMNVEFIINQNINAEKMDYSKTTSEETKLFLGPKYCMLREEFKNACSEKVIKESVEDILLTVGGMDNVGNTIKILNSLKTLKKRIHVVLGKAFDNNVIDNVYKIAEEYK